MNWEYLTEEDRRWLRDVGLFEVPFRYVDDDGNTVVTSGRTAPVSIDQDWAGLRAEISSRITDLGPPFPWNEVR